MTRSSVINLVDLAGSERTGAIGETGDRLREGTRINQSLTTLGNCIKALADSSIKENKKRTDFVQFRESVLTKLLKNALGGNSKTIMIAAVSPAHSNYVDTLSTLRFAERAKAVKTLAVVNERPTDKQIRELRVEVARLMNLLKTSGDFIDMVNEANAISERLNKTCRFEVALCAPQVRGKEKRTNEVCARMRNLGNGTEFMWGHTKFIDRASLMQEMYRNYVNGSDDWDLPQDRDPFWDDPDAEVHVGTVYVKLEPLAYITRLSECLDVTYGNLRMELGRLQVILVPCKKDGKEMISKQLQEPEELIGIDLHFKVKVKQASELPSRYCSTYCEYKMYEDEETTKTTEVGGTNPTYDHVKHYSFHSVSKQFVEYLKNEHLIIDVWGRQQARDVDRTFATRTRNSHVANTDKGTMTVTTTTCIIL